MDISSISGVSMVEEPGSYAESGSNEVDRDAFIKMFLAQLKHQDPLNPMDGSEFAAQLAQFSSLEQLYNVNESLDGLTTLQQDRSQYEVLNLMGREITAEGAYLSLDSEGSTRGGFELETDAECAVLISDENGTPVRSLPLGYLKSGTHEFEWDGESGSGTSLPGGVYQFKVTAVTPYGEQAETTSRMVGRVDRIKLEEGTSTLFMGEIPVKLASVLDIRSAEGKGTTEPADTVDTTTGEVGI
ncbi:MAG: flagellar hook assembly protein FlgD [Deltaproteobacteria bacterium]|nr:flagellar hook assembly protein FlgD [Deltaproteobacteria bacterium]